MTPYLIIAALCAIAFLSIRSALKSRAEAKSLRDELATAANEIKSREEDRRALAKELLRLREGSPSDRLSASLDILRNAAKATGAPDKLASSPPPARDGN